ncbi:MAG: hypothetical protein RLY31_1732 [Bacteroidota bacterium]|jgi:hypothetical protein
MLRFEQKYILPLEQLAGLRQRMEPFMRLDRYAEKTGGSYTVRSIYFETAERTSYEQKLSGVKRRAKLRLRGYGRPEEGHPVFFEIKEKVDEPLEKFRARLSYAQAMQVLAGTPPEEYLGVDTDRAGELNNVRRFLYLLHARQMRPFVTVIYEREPHLSVLGDRANDLRITFDRNLRAVPSPEIADLYGEEGVRTVMNRQFIMEIKFNRQLPGWVRAMTAGLGLVRVPASKYQLSVDACPSLLSPGVVPMPVPFAGSLIQGAYV